MKRTRPIWWLLGALALAATATAVLATGGVYTQTAHGDPVSGALRLAGEPRGDCAQCHDLHASRDGTPTGGPFPYTLFAPNDNALCYHAGGAGGCHAVAGNLEIYPGPTIYERSSHSMSPAMTWPGTGSTPLIGQRPASGPARFQSTLPRRSAGDSGLCLNCHTPHGEADVDGLIPSQTLVREQGLCNTCHDASGPASTDVQSDVQKTSRHPAGDFNLRHRADEDGDPTAYGQSNRHAECEDCHNPHDVRPDVTAPTPPEASRRTRRISRVAVNNGAAGTLPAYTFRAHDDPATVLEYEICFKCHSSWTTQPAGQPDLAVLFNPNNPSYHPVEAAGKNTNIRIGAFVGGWAPTDTLYCSSCHGSDDGLVAGPHGSIYNDLLKAPYTPSAMQRQTMPDEICFLCHNYDTYANDSSSDTVQGYSRWNRPEEGKGHAWHVEQEQRPCYACHESHGSTGQPYLLARNRPNGLTDWQQTADGGRCFPTCHGEETYRINYPR